MPSPNPREDGISQKVDNGIQKEKEKEKVRRKVEKEMESQERARAKGPRMDAGSVVDPTTHPTAPRANPKEKEKQDPPTGLRRKKWNGMRGVRFQKCDHYQDYKQ